MRERLLLNSCPWRFQKKGRTSARYAMGVVGLANDERRSVMLRLEKLP